MGVALIMVVSPIFAHRLIAVTGCEGVRVEAGGGGVGRRALLGIRSALASLQYLDSRPSPSGTPVKVGPNTAKLVFPGF